MEQNEIIEGNRLIALFEGYREIKDYDGWEFAYTIHPTISVACIGDMQLDYHLSWNSLMPVVEKIGKVHNIIIQVGICRIWRRFMETKEYVKANGLLTIDEVPPIAERNDGDFIGNVWLTVVDYIKWYNSQTSKAISNG